MQFGMIGLGRMGANMVRRLTKGGHKCVVYDRSAPTVEGLAKEGMTMLVVTHEMGFARGAAHRVVFMADGEIVEDAPPDTFFTQPRSDRAKDFLGKILSH